MTVVDLFAQTVDVDLDRVRERIEGIVPNMGRDFRPRNQPARISGQMLEQRVFFGCQLDLAIGPRDTMTGGVDDQIVDFENVRVKTRIAPE